MRRDPRRVFWLTAALVSLYAVSQPSCIRTENLDDNLNCNALCAVPHARRVCASGACVFASCDLGYQDCDQDVVSNGCEIDLARDPANCGACGQSCGADQTCTEGSCVAPEVLTTMPTGFAMSLAVDADRVFYSLVATDPIHPGVFVGQVWYLSAAGDAPRLLAERPGSPYAIAVQEDVVYWATRVIEIDGGIGATGSLWRTPIDGASTTLVAARAGIFDAVRTTGPTLVWSWRDVKGRTSIERWTPTATEPAPIVELDGGTLIGLDETFVYFWRRRSTQGGSVERILLEGGAPEVLEDQPDPLLASDFTTDGIHGLWVHRDLDGEMGRLLHVPLDPTEPATELFAGRGHWSGATGLRWIPELTRGFVGTTNEIRVVRPSNGPTTVVASHSILQVFAVDERYLYWWTDRALKRLPSK